MADLTGLDRAQYVRDMFARIAPRYDLMNRLMTAGQDARWRAEVIDRAALPSNASLLDLGTGTGDLALAAKKHHPNCHAVAADFTLEMMQIGRLSRDTGGLNWVAADTLGLPFPDGTFDAVVSGFLMRNVTSIPLALQEQRRVLKPRGRIIILDTTRPPANLLSPLVRFHLHVVIPALGRVLTGHGEAYTYLPESTERFLQAETLAAYMAEAGFEKVGFRRRMFGTVALHWGERG